VSALLEYSKLSEQIVAAHETAHVLARGRYDELVSPWKELISAVAGAHGLPFLDVAYTFACDLHRAGKLDGGAAVWLLAATHDLIDAELKRRERAGVGGEAGGTPAPRGLLKADGCGLEADE
jgi:hypothetical protein